MQPRAEPGIHSSTIADLSRETLKPGEYSPSKRLIRSVRRYQAARGPGPIAWFRRKLAVASHRFWSAVCSSELPLQLKVGGGLLMPHPYGIVIHPEVEIGVNCLIFHGVTIGTSKIGSGVPKLEGHVDVGCGATILGGVTIGEHSVIAANAVVLQDVPPHCVVGGVPARILDHQPVDPMVDSLRTSERF